MKKYVVDIESLNMLLPSMYEKPNYLPKPEHRQLKFYFDGDNLIIKGEADSNY